MKIEYKQVKPYRTKDGSEIRELMHPQIHPVKNLSLAEALLRPRQRTKLHVHHLSEEVYHVLEGQGLMTLGEESFEIVTGDTILIPPGTPHALYNPGEKNLRVLCVCAPAYSHEDTELIDTEESSR